MINKLFLTYPNFTINHFANDLRRLGQGYELGKKIIKGVAYYQTAKGVYETMAAARRYWSKLRRGKKRNKWTIKQGPGGIPVGSTPPKTPRKRKGDGQKPSKKKQRTDMDPSNETHSGIESVSSSMVLRPKLNHGLKTIGRWSYTQNIEDLYTGASQGIISTGGAGYQQVHSVVAVNTAKQMYTSNGPVYSFDENYTALSEMNPYKKITGSAIFNGATAVIQNDRFVILSNQITIELANFCNIPGKIDIYCVTPKKLTNQPPQYHWEQGYIDAGLGLNQIALPTSVAIEPVPVQGTNGLSYPGSKPTESKLFKEYWKVLEVKHLDMAASAQETINFHVKTNKLVKQDVIDEYWNPSGTSAGTPGTIPARSNNYIPNTTVFIMLVKRGALVVDVTPNPGRDITTYGTLQIGWICKTLTKMCAVKGNADRLSTNQQVSTIPINTTLANQKFMDIQDNPSSNEPSG